MFDAALKWVLSLFKGQVTPKRLRREDLEVLEKIRESGEFKELWIDAA